MRHVLSLLAVVVLAGCTSMTAAPSRTVNYRCDEGREFSVSYPASGDHVFIEIARMRFSLQAEATTGSSERYGCGTLTLWRDGEKARVDMAGAGLYENCQERR